MNKPTAVSYNRKSTEDANKQVQSIEDQKKINRQRAEVFGYSLVKEYVEEKSAHKTPLNVIIRPVFNQMMTDIYNGKYDTIFCWKADRLARNAIDGGTIIGLLTVGKLRKIITIDREYTIADQLMLSIEFGMATQYSLDLAKNVKRGLTSKAEKGYKPGIPPIGYKCDWTGDKGKKSVFIDEVRFPMVRKIYDMMLTGLYTVPQILNIANEEWGFRTPKGNKLHKSTLYRMLNNTFYYGEFTYGGETYPGIHTPICTAEEYDKIQFILGKHGTPRPSAHEFPFTGTIKCAECGCSATAEEKYKMMSDGSVKKYVYYHCTGKKPDYPCQQKGKSITESYIDGRVSEIIENLDIPQEYIDWAEKYLKENVERDKSLMSKRLSQLEKVYEEAVKRIDALIDLRLGHPDALTEDEFMQKKNELTVAKDRALKAVNEFNEDHTDGVEQTIELMNFCMRAKEKFATDDPKEKRKVFTRLGSKFLLKDKILDIDLEESIFVMKKHTEAILAQKVTLERSGKIHVNAKFPPVELVSSMIRSRVDSNHKPTP